MESKTIKIPKDILNKKQKLKIPYNYHSVWEIVYLYDLQFMEWFRKKYMVPTIHKYICTRNDRMNEMVDFLRSLNTDEKTITAYQKEYDNNSVKYITNYLKDPKTLERELEKHGFKLDFLDKDTDDYYRDTTTKSLDKIVIYTLDRGVLQDVMCVRGKEEKQLKTEICDNILEETIFSNENCNRFDRGSDHQYRVLEHSPEYRQGYSNLTLVEVIMHQKDIEYEFIKVRWKLGIHTDSASYY